MNDKVSVLLPLYGTFDPEKVKMGIASLKNQKNIDLEISVAEQSTKPTLSGIRGVTYEHSLPVFSSDGYLIPGLVRNLAAKNSSGNFIYNNDGDIIFGNPNYLNSLLQLIKKDEKLCLYQPAMRRIPLDNFVDFKNRFERGGIKKTIDDLDLSQPYGATYKDNFIKIRHFKKDNDGDVEISVATEKDHRAYHSGDNKGKEPFFYTLHIHAGGTMMARSQFEKIGGYCEDFAGWGCHDVDIQYKLKSLFNLQKIHKISDLEILHLDHQRGYFANPRWEKNKSLLIKRQSMPIENITNSDRERYNDIRI